MWFEELFGFSEGDVADVAEQFANADGQLTSLPNGRIMRHGEFETPTLAELRLRTAGADGGPGGRSGALRVREVVGDVGQLHLDPANAGAVFQVASQFNTLEMVSPSVTPEDGIERYASDHTQGPACAIACAAGTVYRNYLVDVDGQTGQTADRQINCLADLAIALDVDVDMQNGYALATGAALQHVGQRLAACDPSARDGLMGALRVGVQRATEVTLGGAGHVVTQVYCSALPVAYSSEPTSSWEPFARLVLDAAYEATLAASVGNAVATGNNRVYLTLLGGGVFGNRSAWILDALDRSLGLYADADLDVRIVSHGQPNATLERLLSRR